MVAANASAATAKIFVERRDSNDMRGSITPIALALAGTGEGRDQEPGLRGSNCSRHLPNKIAVTKQKSVAGGNMLPLAISPALALVGFTNGSSVGGTSRPVASGHSASTGFASTRYSNTTSLCTSFIGSFIRSSGMAALIIDRSQVS